MRRQRWRPHRYALPNAHLATTEPGPTATDQRHPVVRPWGRSRPRRAAIVSACRADQARRLVWRRNVRRPSPGALAGVSVQCRRWRSVQIVTRFQLSARRRRTPPMPPRPAIERRTRDGTRRDQRARRCRRARAIAARHRRPHGRPVATRFSGDPEVVVVALLDHTATPRSPRIRVWCRRPSPGELASGGVWGVVAGWRLVASSGLVADVVLGFPCAGRAEVAGGVSTLGGSVGVVGAVVSTGAQKSATDCPAAAAAASRSVNAVPCGSGLPLRRWASHAVHRPFLAGPSSRGPVASVAAGVSGATATVGAEVSVGTVIGVVVTAMFTGVVGAVVEGVDVSVVEFVVGVACGWVGVGWTVALGLGRTRPMCEVARAIADWAASGSAPVAAAEPVPAISTPAAMAVRATHRRVAEPRRSLSTVGCSAATIAAMVVSSAARSSAVAGATARASSAATPRLGGRRPVDDGTVI